MKTLLGIIFLTFPIFAEVPVISVTGTAMRAVDPNTVVLQIEAWSRSTLAKQAQESVAKEHARIRGVVEKFKIKKEDFETTSYTLAPELEYNNKGGSKIVGYRASHLLQVTHRKVEEAGSLIDALSTAAKIESAGVNIQSVSWDYDKRSQVEFSLLSEALKEAKKQADELAKASGVKIKGPHRITTGSEGPQPVQFRKMHAEAALASSSTEISTGAVKIKVQVNADYQIQ